MKDPVLIKSNRYGITIYFDSDMPFEELTKEVKKKFETSAHFFEHADMQWSMRAVLSQKRKSEG